MSVADSSPFPIQPSRLGKLRGRVPWVCSPRDTLVMVSCQAVRLSQEHLGLTCSALLPLSLLPPVPLFRRCSPLRTRLFQPVLTLAPCRPLHSPLPPCSRPRPTEPFFIQWCGTARNLQPDNGPGEPFDWPPCVNYLRLLRVNELAVLTGGRRRKAPPGGCCWKRRRRLLHLFQPQRTICLGYWMRSSKGKNGIVPKLNHILRNRSVGARLIPRKGGIILSWHVEIIGTLLPPLFLSTKYDWSSYINTCSNWSPS